MKKSEQINELSAALAKAQGEIAGAIKETTNPFFGKAYADLGSVWDACRVPLSKNGLSIMQIPETSPEGKVILLTVLAHSSGQWIEGGYPINPVKNDPQGMGSAVTYARRYSLAAIVGIYQVDDDGNAASGKDDPKIDNVKEVVNKPGHPSEQEISEAFEEFEKPVSKPSVKPSVQALVDPETCNHKWLPNKFTKNTEWCPQCKSKRAMK